MSTDVLPPPDFEIDHPQEYAPYFLNNSREIQFYLDLLAKRHNLITAHVDDGGEFFATSILAVDAENQQLFLDPAQEAADDRLALGAQRLTLLALLDRIKMQFRLPALHPVQYQGRRVYAAPLPSALLRLQRREFFRLEPPVNNPLFCNLRARDIMGREQDFKLRVTDISGGGIGLSGPVEAIEYFPTSSHLDNCRLEIPGELTLLLNLRVRKAVEVSTSTGQHALRVGCEYVDLPGSRLGVIERYITRIERERKAKATGIGQ